MDKRFAACFMITQENTYISTSVTKQWRSKPYVLIVRRVPREFMQAMLAASYNVPLADNTGYKIDQQYAKARLVFCNIISQQD